MSWFDLALAIVVWLILVIGTEAWKFKHPDDDHE